MKIVDLEVLKRMPEASVFAEYDAGISSELFVKGRGGQEAEGFFYRGLIDPSEKTSHSSTFTPNQLFFMFEGDDISKMIGRLQEVLSQQVSLSLRGISDVYELSDPAPVVYKDGHFNDDTVIQEFVFPNMISFKTPLRGESVIAVARRVVPQSGEPTEVYEVKTATGDFLARFGLLGKHRNSLTITESEVSSFSEDGMSLSTNFLDALKNALRKLPKEFYFKAVFEGAETTFVAMSVGAIDPTGCLWYNVVRDGEVLIQVSANPASGKGGRFEGIRPGIQHDVMMDLACEFHKALISIKSAP